MKDAAYFFSKIGCATISLWTCAFLEGIAEDSLSHCESLGIYAQKSSIYGKFKISQHYWVNFKYPAIVVNLKHCKTWNVNSNHSTYFWDYLTTHMKFDSKSKSVLLSNLAWILRNLETFLNMGNDNLIKIR